ncbi:MAG TPA: hypothetical protein VF472_07290 [Burkholderiaceae bacterium]
MTSNLELAKKAIEAEVALAKQGMAYYEAQVAALEQALSQLQRFGNPGAVAKAKRGPKGVEAAQETKPRRGRPPKGAHDLPFTGGDYWSNLVTAEPKAAKDILKSAVAGLGFEPAPEQVKKLQQRMIFALNALVKEKTIRDSGAGRDRRYFK